jgi:hypothetical protein
VAKFHFHCLHGVPRVRSFMKPDHCHQPLLDGLQTLINSHVWNSTVYCKVTARLPTPTKVTNSSNLSLNRDPTGGNKNSREIQKYAHFSATLYINIQKISMVYSINTDSTIKQQT